jgi:hypothetical protein
MCSKYADTTGNMETIMTPFNTNPAAAGSSGYCYAIADPAITTKILFCSFRALCVFCGKNSFSLCPLRLCGETFFLQIKTTQ